MNQGVIALEISSLKSENVYSISSGEGSCMVAAIVLAAFISDAGEFQLESKVKTTSGLYERFVDPQDERRFQVRWTKPSGEKTIIVDSSERTRSRIYRRPLSGLRLTGIDEVVEWDPQTRSEKVLGQAKRIFYNEYGCRALALLPTPTALDRHKVHQLKNLNCNEDGRPLPANASLIIETDHDPFELPCYFGIGNFCFWVSESAASEVNKGQLLSLVSLQKLQNFLTSAKLETFLPTLKVNAWASDSNLSFYDSQSQTIFLGTGRYPDSHDGFIVTHEWGHFALDQLNPGVWGYDAEVIHEALSDYLSATVWGSACIAPFDAQEESNRRCLRRLDRRLSFPRDMIWSDAHEDSQVVSGALWEGFESTLASSRWSFISEAIISLPKNFELHEFWDAVLQAHSRRSSDGTSRGSDHLLSEVLRRRGFLK